MNIYVRFVFPEMYQSILYTKLWGFNMHIVISLYRSVCAHIYIYIEEMEAFCLKTLKCIYITDKLYYGCCIIFVFSFEKHYINNTLSLYLVGVLQ